MGELRTLYVIGAPNSVVVVVVGEVSKEIVIKFAGKRAMKC